MLLILNNYLFYKDLIKHDIYFLLYYIHIYYSSIYLPYFVLLSCVYYL